MPDKKNPLGLNTLQLKTLTILQAVAEIDDAQVAERHASDGSVKIKSLPHAHGNHFHVGKYLVSASDATGLQNSGVWAALERKGLVATDFPNAVTLTKDALDYDTGLRDSMLHTGDH